MCLFFRWARLKDALIDKRSKLGESQTLQQFSRDADEIENWILEKLQVAQEESYKDPTNIQVEIFLEFFYEKIFNVDFCRASIRNSKLSKLNSRRTLIGFKR